MLAFARPRYLGVLALLGISAGAVRAQEVSGIQAAAAIEDALVAAIARAEKSVVAIARVRVDQPGEIFSLEIRPDPFGRQVRPSLGADPTDPDFIPNEYGSGVVVGSGLILTAYHVLGDPDANEYYVKTRDRKAYKARVKAADPRSDLAVLAVDADDLVKIAFGDADELKKGRIVVALGNPYAIARDGQVSASWGIVSNLARKAPPVPSDFERTSRPTLHHFGTLIQTDAKLNLGTSGGPLLNLKGEMVGLCVALAATAGYEGAAGYAIPVDETFRRVLRSLTLGREVEYGFLGIRPSNLAADEVLRGQQGIRVSEVEPGTPAYRFGLEESDIVTAVNGRPIYEADSLVLEVGKLPVDSVARMTVLRNGRQRTVPVTLAKYPVDGKRIFTVAPPDWRGLRVDYVTSVSPIGRFEDGVLVVDVEQDSPAWESGLRPGMIIREVGDTPVLAPRDFRAEVAGRRGPVELNLIDRDQPIVVEEES